MSVSAYLFKIFHCYKTIHNVDCNVKIFSFISFDFTAKECTALLLPLINEDNWNLKVRAMLYLAAMIWCFLGVAIISDLFMCSIERITSKTRKIRISDPKDKDGFREVEVKVWNDTVANLSLMALGTSAPEILLSVIETIGNKFKSGELGPSTIVGSAAFNLLVITSICMVSIPKDESRQIRSTNVFAVTTLFNMFAYIWLAVVLLSSTKDVVSIWEAVITFLLFPTLVIVAYVADKNFFRTKNKVGTPIEIGIGEFLLFANCFLRLFLHRYMISNILINIAQKINNFM